MVWGVVIVVSDWLVWMGCVALGLLPWFVVGYFVLVGLIVRCICLLGLRCVGLVVA